MPKILISTTEGNTLEFELTAERARFGRAGDNDFVIPDGSVSSYHGEFINRGDSVEVIDLGSTNGTTVNGARVDQALIGPGDGFQLGSCQAIVEGEALESSPEVASAPASAPQISLTSSAPASEVVSGLGATPCPANLRSNFGPKKKEKADGSALLLLGVVALVACAAALFLISSMAA